MKIACEIPEPVSRVIVMACLMFFSCPATAKEAQVSSLRPGDLAEFDAQPEKVKQLLTYALKLTGQNLAYLYGSCDPAKGGLDCSGTVNHVLTHLGYRSPRQCNTIYLWVRKNGNLNEVKTASSLNDSQIAKLKPGDLLFWEGTYEVGGRFPATSHVMIYLGHRKSDNKPVMVGASSGRYYNGRARHGVSVFDFRLPRSGSKSRFVGYGPVPGIKSLGIELPALKKIEKLPATPGTTKNAKSTAPATPRPYQNNAVAKAKDSVTDEPWRYLIYLPSSYPKNETTWPMILYLHGRSIRGHDLNRVKRYGPPAMLDRRPDFPFVVVSPQLPDGSWPAKSLVSLLDELIKTYRIDSNRVYLTGVSMGGGGAWNLAAAAPDRFAALAPLCGYGGLSIAPKLTGLPILAFHGAKDETVPIKPHRDLVAAINKSGGSATLKIIPDGTHGSIITSVYQDQDLYQWFLSHRNKEVEGSSEKGSLATTAKKTTSKPAEKKQPAVSKSPPPPPRKQTRPASPAQRNTPARKIGKFLKKVFDR